MSEQSNPRFRFPNVGKFDVPKIDSGILSRVQDMYSGKEGSTPKDSGGKNVIQNTLGGVYSSAALGMIPGAGPALNALTGALTNLQSNSGLRSGRIKELAGDGEKRGTYDSSSNSYSGLNILDRVMDIKPDAVTSQIAADRKKALENSDAVREIKLEKGEEEFNKIFPKGSATSNLEVESVAREIDTRRGLLEDIKTNLGSERLVAARKAAQGRKLTNSELQLIADESFKATPKQQRLKSESEAEVDLKGKQGQAALTEASASQTAAGAQVTSAKASALTAETGRINAINADRIAQAKLAFEQEKIKYERDVALYGIDAKTREANLDRTLRKDLAVLGLEDKKSEREYDRSRDERKDRQLMIMQLLGGLKNLGGAFAL